jgi:Fe-S oxidoreductase
MAHHYARRLRPRHAYAFGHIDRWLKLARPMAGLANKMAGFVKRFAGIAPEREVPRIAKRSFRDTFRPPQSALSAPRVVLWPDTFNDAFYPDVLHAAVDLLVAAGYAPELPRTRLCCGRPMFELGWIEPTRRLWRHTLAELAEAIDAGVPVVGIEPSCTAMFRDELHAMFPDDERAARLAAQTKTLGELLADWQPPAGPRRHALYHRHCHQQAVLDPSREVALLERAGLDVEVLDSGCCGMAGAFGFEADKYELSVALAERVLLPAIREQPDALVITDGFSCREQIRQLAHVRAHHVGEVLTSRASTR